MKMVRAVERAIDILMSFDRGAPMLGVAELQARLKLSRPTLYRLLYTLEKRGLIHAEGEPQRFRLHFGVMRLCDALLGQLDVVAISDPTLNELWAKTDETVALYMPVSDRWRVSVKERRSRQPLSFSRGVGHSDPTTDGASGRAMLAFFGDARIEAVLKEVADAGKRAALRTDLARIRRNGYSLTVSEMIIGAVAIAAPVFDRDGSVVASLCLFGPEARIRGALRMQYIRQVVAAAGQVSAALGAKHAQPLTRAVG